MSEQEAAAQAAEPVATPETVVEAPASPEQATVAPGTTETVAESDEQKAERLLKAKQIREDRARRRVQDRFNEMADERRSLQRQVEQLTALALGRTQQPVPQDAEPKRDSFDSYEAYLEAKAEWKAERKVESALARDRQERQQREQQQGVAQQTQHVAAEFERRQSEFAKQHADYREVVLENDDVQIPDSALALIPMLPEGHVAAYAIGKNPDLAQSLWGKPPYVQAAILGQIAAAFKSSPQVSNAPPPSKPVAPRAVPSADISDTDSTEEWMRKRNAAETKRRST